MRKYLSLIKFSHTIFALPFALVGYFIAVNSSEFAFDLFTLALVLLCMLFARSAAMAFNRFADRHIDSQNDRTSSREIPAGIISAKSALAFVVLNCVLFVTTTFFINRLCFFLSPVALAVILGYSYTKRFTSLSHLVLGLGLSLAPVGAYIAVTEHFALLPICLGAVVLFWVAGFDIVYALQDTDFDHDQRLHSIPARIGKQAALFISILLHALCAVILVYTAYQLSAEHSELSWIFGTGTFIFLALLLYQHLIISSTNLTRVNMAFFTTNGVASVIFGLFLILDFYV